VTKPPKSLLNLADDLQKAANTAAAKEKQAMDELAKERESFKAAVEDLNSKLKTSQDNLAKANKGRVGGQAGHRRRFRTRRTRTSNGSASRFRN